MALFKKKIVKLVCTDYSQKMTQPYSKTLRKAFWLGIFWLTLHIKIVCCQNGRNPDGITVERVPRTIQACFGFADWYANVFGTMVIGAGVKRQSVQHVADVLAGYLDNDQNGLCDDSKVCKKLRESLGTIIMFRNKHQANRYWDTPWFFKRIGVQWYSNNIELNGVTLHQFFEEDIVVHSCAYGGVFKSYMTKCQKEFDLTLETTLQFITSNGVSLAYDTAFGKREDSILGGHIKELNGNCGWGFSKNWINPSSDGCTGYFAYSDSSCKYACIVTRGLYWAISSMLGAQDYKQQIEAIADEWLLYDESLLRAHAPSILALIEDTAVYPWLPKQLPNGTYYANPRAIAPSVVNYSAYFTGLIAFVAVLLSCGIYFCWRVRRLNMKGFDDYSDDEEERIRKLDETTTNSTKLTDNQKIIQLQQHEEQRRQFHREVFV